MNDLRELNGHPLRVLRAQHNLTLEELARETGVAAATISRAENGHLVSAAVRRLLCKYFNKTSQELGLLGRGKDLSLDPVPPQPTLSSPELPTITPPLVEKKEAPTIIITHAHPFDILNEQVEHSLQQQLGAWLALEACQLGQLFDANWTIEGILASLRVVLQGVQGMPKISRRKLLELGGAAAMSGITLPSSNHVTEEERVQLCEALNASVAEGWKLFHRVENTQVLAIGQAQLHLVKQVDSIINPRVRSSLYAPIYMLIGSSLHFQSRYDEALRMHISAHIAAMEAGKLWLTCQSLICQANSQQGLGQHHEAMQTIEAALRLIEYQIDEQYIRAKAHLLACWADNAMTIGDNYAAQKKLGESEMYLDQILPNEEFDRTSWLHFSGKYALMTGDAETALQYYEQALALLPPDWIVQQIFILIPMMVAYTCQHNRSASLHTAQKALSALKKLNAPTMNRQFVESMNQSLYTTFSENEEVRTFVEDVKRQVSI